MTSGRHPIVEPDTTTYPGMVAARLRALRLTRGWTVKELREKLEQEGESVSLCAIYAWERGHGAGGNDLPLRMVSVVARIYGYLSPTGWLPSDWPVESITRPIRAFDQCGSDRMPCESSARE
jgi:hypothetical protein